MRPNDETQVATDEGMSRREPGRSQEESAQAAIKEAEPPPTSQMLACCADGASGSGPSLRGTLPSQAAQPANQPWAGETFFLSHS